MRRRIALALAFLAAATAARASGHGVDAGLEAYASPEGPLNVALHVTNRGDRPVCFFVSETGIEMIKPHGMYVIGPPTHGAEVSSVQFVRNDGHEIRFGIGELATPKEARQITKLVYHLRVYDCRVLFKYRDGEAPALFTRELSVVPTIYD